jgi:hypothetical protein
MKRIIAGLALALIATPAYALENLIGDPPVKAKPQIGVSGLGFRNTFQENDTSDLNELGNNRTHLYGPRYGEHEAYTNNGSVDIASTAGPGGRVYVYDDHSTATSRSEIETWGRHPTQTEVGVSELCLGLPPCVIQDSYTFDLAGRY